MAGGGGLLGGLFGPSPEPIQKQGRNDFLETPRFIETGQPKEEKSITSKVADSKKRRRSTGPKANLTLLGDIE